MSRPFPKFEELIRATPVLSRSGDGNPVVTGLRYDSRNVVPGDLFCALPGGSRHGKHFVREAVDRGAVALLSDTEITVREIPIARVADARVAMADLASSFYQSPSASLGVAGVTGTNGKTTTAWIIRHVCNAVGRSCGLIGTIRYILPGVEEGAVRTTPESTDLQRMLALMRDGGYKAAALEVSSHALVQDRVRGIEFDAAVFTNLTQDHLDYHGSMENYFKAKKRLFIDLAGQIGKKGRAIINGDDRYGHRLLERMNGVPVITYGQGSNCAFRASNIRHTALGTTFRLDAKRRSYLVRTPLVGLFNVYNTLAALAAVSAMGVELRRAVAAAASISQVPGRLERIPVRRGFQAYVDYAHTPDAVTKVLESLRQLEPRRIITVFGCGGDRDRSKRPLMAAAAERHSDLVIVTSDNPRGEDPLSIIREVEKGFRGNHHESFVDRERAIRRAVEAAGEGDLVLIAGKGHETHQETAGDRHSFDDVSVTARAMSEKSIPETR